MRPLRVFIVSPALAAANNGNWHTAFRWQQFLSPCARVDIALAWDGQPADALIALHARRSAASVARFAAAHAERPLAVVLTGTDLYRDVEAGDADAIHSLECASHVVALQDAALDRLAPPVRAKARVIVQSAERRVAPRRRPACFVAVGHLRDEKDPRTLIDAVRRLPPGSPVQVLHIGGALDPALGAAALETMAECPRYRWIGARSAPATRRWIGRAAALVHMSRIEGGANVVIEAVRSDVPVLASRIDGNLGLLGRDYAGCFPVGDANALAALMQRFVDDAPFARRLAAQCAERSPRFAPWAEAAAVQRLLDDMLRGSGPGSYNES